MAEVATQDNLEKIARELRTLILEATTKAGSGHPTSSLSAVELMASLFFGGFFKADFKDPTAIDNDRLIFSKGHAAPLFYALYAQKGAIKKDELSTLRQFGSRLEGHPTLKFPWTEVPTGSLGQGLSVGVGMALAAKMDKLNYHTFVLLGDGEMMEGSNWEAAAIASHYGLANLTAIIDVNRWEQAGESCSAGRTDIFQDKFRAFGWLPIVINDGNNLEEVQHAFKFRFEQQEKKPVVIIGRTVKGKGVSLLADKPGWHGKALDEIELKKALKEIEQKPEVKAPNTETDKLLQRLANLSK